MTYERVLALIQSLKTRPALRKAVQSTGWLVFDRIIRILLILTIGTWQARYLGPEQFGLMTYVWTTVTMFLTFAGLGSDGLILRELVEVKANQKRSVGSILGTALAMRQAASVVCGIICVIGFKLLNPGDYQAQHFAWIVMSAYFFSQFNIVELWFQAEVKQPRLVKAKLILALFLTVVRVVLIVKRASLLSFVWMTAIDLMSTTILTVTIYLVEREADRRWRFESKLARALFFEGWPLMFASFAIFIYMRIDQVMIRQLAGDYESGIYAAATRLSEGFFFVPSAIVASVTPALIHSRSSNREVYHARLQKLFAIMSAIGLSLGVGCLVLSRPAVHIMFGDRFAASAPVLIIHVWSSIFVFWSVAQEPWFINEGLTKFIMVRAVFGAVLNIILNFFLIPRYGAAGAAIATVVAYGMVWASNGLSVKTRMIFKMQIRSLLFPKYLGTHFR